MGRADVDILDSLSFGFHGLDAASILAQAPVHRRRLSGSFSALGNLKKENFVFPSHFVFLHQMVIFAGARAAPFRHSNCSRHKH